MSKVLSRLCSYSAFILTLVFPNLATAQNAEIRKVQQQNKVAISNAYAASVRIWGYDTVKKVQNSSQFSGVVVDLDGTILTVSHAIQPNRTYKVRFTDGREAMAVAKGKAGFPESQNRPDLGMMQLTTKGKWPVAKMGWSHSLKAGQVCISISYPESLNQLLPTVRFGKITKVMDEWGFVESSCKMEPGDSGGPLFDGFGRVIGMHGRCEKGEDENFEVPIDLYRKYWTALHVAENYKALPERTDEIGKDPLMAKIRPLPVDLVAVPSQSGKNRSAVIIKSTQGGQIQQAYATLIEYHGVNYLVSKSSIVAADASLDAPEKNLELKILSRDAQNDLVLLSAPEMIGSPLPFESLKEAKSPIMKNLGEFLYSRLNGKIQISIISSLLFDLPKKPVVGFAGIAANFNNGKATITRVAPQGPAITVGLQPNDDIVEINWVKVTSAEVFNGEMQKSAPGDTLTILMSRDGTTKTVKLVMAQRPPSTHAAEQFDGGKSVRRDDFKNVFAHDAIIRPNECGSPVFDVSGNFYGINIARFSRTSTIIMPSAQIAEFLEKFSSSGKQ